MGKSIFLASAMVVSALAASVGAANAAGSASYTINITGYVPVVCHINSAQTATVTGGSADLGSVAEFCNNPTGYQVWLDYAAGATGTVSVDGQLVQLSSTGSTMIDTSNTAASLSRHVTLQNTSGLQTVSIRIIPV